ncbi:MAG: flagellar basal body P-ring formation chaperone FlgA [Vampirovibrionia bacterium]
MKRLLIITLLSIASIFSSMSVIEAKEVKISDVEPMIKSFVVDHYKDLYEGKISVSCGRMPGLPAELPEGKVEIKIKSNLRDTFVERSVIRVSLFVDGKFQKALGVPVSLSLKDRVWVATESIERNDAISGGNVKLVERDISKYASTAARSNSELINTRVKRTFKAGDILDHRFIEKDPVVMRNSMVAIVFQSSTVSVSITGEAMEDGSIGDIVRVRNGKFNKEYAGKVIDRGVVLVNI